MGGVVKVGYAYVNDLYYRIRHARLKNEVYILDFLDWVKAGIAFNVLGVKEPSRKVSEFAAVYQNLQDIPSGNSEVLVEGLQNYYADLFKLYQDHLIAQLNASKRSRPNECPEVKDVYLLPSFEKVPQLKEIFDTVEINLQEYESKYPDDFLSSLATIYVREGSAVYRLMSVYYDFGMRRENTTLIGRIIL